jgi:hypothetical protein
VIFSTIFSYFVTWFYWDLRILGIKKEEEGDTIFLFDHTTKDENKMKKNY